MHSDMNTNNKLKILKSMLNEGEELIISVGGHLIPNYETDPIMHIFSVATTQEWGNSNQDDGDVGFVKNMYIGLTEKNLYVAILDTYHPDIVRRKAVVPLGKIHWDYYRRSLRNHIGLKINGKYEEIVVPSTKELTGLTDQREEAKKLMDYAEDKVLEQNPLWVNLMNR